MVGIIGPVEGFGPCLAPQGIDKFGEECGRDNPHAPLVLVHYLLVDGIPHGYLGPVAEHVHEGVAGPNKELGEEPVAVGHVTRVEAGGEHESDLGACVEVHGVR
jgi:hypothetical protein